MKRRASRVLLTSAALLIAALLPVAAALAIDLRDGSGSSFASGVATESLEKIGLPSTNDGAGHRGSRDHARPVVSGVPMPVGNVRGWKQVFADDFTTPVKLGQFSGCKPVKSLMRSNCSRLPRAVRSKLFAYPYPWSDGNHGRYDPAKVLSIHNGMLDYYLHTSKGVHEVAAVEPKIRGGIDGNGRLYGAYAIRFKADFSEKGYKVAFLLWPDSGFWPEDGEIDFPEGGLTSKLFYVLHYMGASNGSDQALRLTNYGFKRWHTYMIEWTPTECTFILDGRVIGKVTTAIPSDPMHWVLQAQTTSNAPAASVSGHIYIAWIVAYAPTSKAD